MTAFQQDYRFRVYEEASDSVVEFTFIQEIGQPPEVPGQTIRPEDCAAETVPWSIELVDRNQVVSATLGDSTTGRFTYHGRVADLSYRDNGGSWVVVATGRISDVSEPERGVYVIQVEDERMVEREADVFQETDTLVFAPPGLKYGYGGIPPVPSCRATVEKVRTVSGSDYVLLNVHVRVNSKVILSHFINDLKAEALQGLASGSNHDEGNFQTLRIYVDGAEREIVTFDTYYAPGVVNALAFEPWPATTWVESMKRRRNSDASSGPSFQVWVPVGDSDSGDNTWPTTPPSANAEFTDVQIYSVGLRPSAEFPLHVGVADAAHTYGTADGKIHPFELLELLYTEAGVRFDATAIQALQDDPRYQPCEYRITEPPDNLAEWVDEHIYKPWQVVPFIGSDGEIEPRSVALPGGDTYDPDALFEFTEHNMVGGAPTWQSPGREAKNVIIGSYLAEDRPYSGALMNWANLAVGGPVDKPTADFITADEVTIDVEHDNLTKLQRREHKLYLAGIHRRSEAEPIIKRYAMDMFSLFGDGPQRGVIQGLRDTLSVQPGDWVKVTTSNAPNPAAAGGRGGTRLVLVLSRAWAAGWPEFEILDGGASVQILSTPTISGVVNGTRAEHTQVITYSGLPGAGTTDWGYLEYAVNATEPPASSPLWRLSKIIVGSAAGSVTGYNLPSGSVIWWRLRAATPFRVRSAWSTAASQTTASLSAPSALSFSEITAKEAKASWTNGEDSYPIEVLVDSAPIDVLAEGATETYIRNLEASTSYTVQIRHIDPMEQPAGIERGASSLHGSASNLTTTGSANTWPAPSNILVLPPGQVGVPQ